MMTDEEIVVAIKRARRLAEEGTACSTLNREALTSPVVAAVFTLLTSTDCEQKC